MLPELFLTLKGYTRRQALSDVGAGVIVGIVALPLAIAFAIASGLPPEYGLYTAIVAGFLISALGGSRVQIGGPTGAFVVIVYGIVQEHGVDGLLIATMMAGVMLVILGLARLGAAIKFIPFPVTTGFTSGIAVIIFSGQIGDLLGLPVENLPAEFVGKLGIYATQLGAIDPVTTAVGLGTLVILIGWPHISRTIPGPLIALLAASAGVALLDLDVATIGTRYGGVEMGLPSLRIPSVSFETASALFAPAFAIAILAAIESLLSAVIADGMIGTRHRSNVELVAQGVANIASPLFGGMPATGAIARTATNIRSGATSPVSGIVHGLTLLAVVLAAAPLARFIPLPALAGILMIVAYRMGEWHAIASILRLPSADRLVWAGTFALTVFADLTVAVEVGMVLAALLYIHNVSTTTTVGAVTDETLGDGEPRVITDKYIPAYCSVVRIRGPFLFGATEKLEAATRDLTKFGPIVVLKVTYMSAIDGTGIHALESLALRLQEAGRSLVICGAQPQPMELISCSKLMKLVGRKNLQPHLDAALERAAIIYGGFDTPHVRVPA